jgi:hypothetical protein
MGKGKQGIWRRELTAVATETNANATRAEEKKVENSMLIVERGGLDY